MKNATITQIRKAPKGSKFIMWSGLVHYVTTKKSVAIRQLKSGHYTISINS